MYCELKELALEPAAQPMKKMEVFNCQSYVNLRAEATANPKSFAQLTLGTEVEATGNAANGFIEVIYKEMKGFVANCYLKQVVIKRKYPRWSADASFYIFNLSYIQKILCTDLQIIPN